MTDGKDLLSEDLLQKVEEAARAQNRKPAEVLRDAVTQYLDGQGFQALVGRAEARNRAKGRTEADVPRLISELRDENRPVAGRCSGLRRILM